MKITIAPNNEQWKTDSKLGAISEEEKPSVPKHDHLHLTRYSPKKRFLAAFTLIEVMIASTVFFIGMFSILSLMSQGLNAARLLRRDGPTAGMIAAQLFANAATNRVDETSDMGDFGDAYRGFKWAWETVLITNGMYRLDIVVTRDGSPYSALTTFIYDSKAGAYGPRRM